MLYNDEFLFLHYPKTAGKSVSVHFCQNFTKPIYGLVSPGQFQEINMQYDQGVFLEHGRGHENLKQAKTLLSEKGIDIYKLRAIFVVARNPYALIVSNYNFLRNAYKANPAMRSKKNFQLAALNNFKTFCHEYNPACFSKWIELDGVKPPNLHLIYFDDLANNLSNFLALNGVVEEYPLLHLNKSSSHHSDTAIDEECKQLIDQKFHHLFRLGNYKKELKTMNTLIGMTC